MTSAAATLSIFTSDITINYSPGEFSAVFTEAGTGVFYTAKLDQDATDVLYALNARVINFARPQPTPVMVTLSPNGNGEYTILGLY